LTRKESRRTDLIADYEGFAAATMQKRPASKLSLRESQDRALVRFGADLRPAFISDWKLVLQPVRVAAPVCLWDLVRPRQNLGTFGLYPLSRRSVSSARLDSLLVLQSTRSRPLARCPARVRTVIATAALGLRAFMDYRRRYIEVLTDPQGLKSLIECPCKHPSCFWAKASTPMIIKATRTSPATIFFFMATTPVILR
jgi:hypothetical protein